MKPIKSILKPNEVGQLLALDEHEVLCLLEEGKLSGARVGEGWRITNADLNDYLRRQGSQGLGGLSVASKRAVRWGVGAGLALLVGLFASYALAQ